MEQKCMHAQTFQHSHWRRPQRWHVENPLCLPEFIHTDIQVSVVWAHKLTLSNLPDNGCNGATGPLAFSVTHHHACVETGWQLGALGPTAVADGAFTEWTVARCVYHNLVMDSKIPPTSLADMCHNFAYKSSNSSPDILTAVSEDLIRVMLILFSGHQQFMGTPAEETV